MDRLALNHVFAALAFVGFIALGVAVSWGARRRPPAIRRRRIGGFLLYTLAISFGAGVLQKNWYPFAHWWLVAAAFPDTWSTTIMVGVDAGGTEHRIDTRAWDPLSVDELGAWFRGPFFTLDSAQQAAAATFLIEKAETARLRVRSGGDPGYMHRWLGPLWAPYFDLHPVWWAESDDAPVLPLTGLRLYFVSWVLPERWGEPTHYARQLVYEYAPR